MSTLSATRPTRYYRISRAGRRRLERAAREWAQTTEIVARFLTPGEESV